MKKHTDISNSKPLESHFYKFMSYGFDTYKVFEDFLDLTIISFCNATSPKDERREAREKRYFDIIGRYKRELVDLFPKMLADLIMLMEDNREGETDILGQFFMEHITHGQNGQYFTPTPISRMIAQVSMGDGVKSGAKVADPSGCGSGRMLLAALEISRDIEVHGVDLDWRCVKMATINLFMRGAKGYTYCMNGLTLEVYGGYKFGMWGGCVPYLIELSKDEIVLTEPQKEQIKQAAEDKKIGGLFDF